MDSYICMSDVADYSKSETVGNGSSTNPTENNNGADGKLNLDVYVQDFETPFLERSRQFYSQLSEDWMKECNVERYMKNVEKYLEDETSWANTVMDPSTVPKISIAVLDV